MFKYYLKDFSVHESCVKVALVLLFSVASLPGLENKNQKIKSLPENNYSSCFMQDFEQTAMNSVLKLKGLEYLKTNREKLNALKSNDKEFLFLAGLNSLSPRMYNALIAAAFISEKGEKQTVEDFVNIMNNDELFSALSLSQLPHNKYKELIREVDTVLSSPASIATKHENIMELVKSSSMN